MPQRRLHDNEVDLDDDEVAGLIGASIAAQFPQWAELALRQIPSSGTENRIFRLGDEFGVRVPRLERAVQQIEREHGWLPRIAAQMPVALHEPVEIGQPGEGYPYPFSIYRWIEGTDAISATVPDPVLLATDVGEFVRALQRVDPSDAPPAGRRGHELGGRDRSTRKYILALADQIDVDRALAVWDNALAAGEWDRPPVWVHGDILPGNVVVRDGRLAGIIDWSSGGIGDPACEAMFAWSLPADARTAFREASDLDDRTWRRGVGWTIEQATSFILNYGDNLPDAVAAAKQRLAAVLD